MAQSSEATLARFLLGVAAGIGLASLIDLAGRQTYRNLQGTMPKPHPWTLSEVFKSATNGLDESRPVAGRARVGV